MDLIKAGASVLVLSASQNFSTSSCASTNISIKTVEDFLQSNVQNIDAIVFDAETVQLTSELVSKAIGLGKPEAVIIIQNLLSDLVANTEFLVRTNGLVNLETIQTKNGQMTVVAYKPKYDVGSTTKLNLSRKPAATVWKLDGDDDETIDPDELLDEEDYVKPDPTSLRVCGTTGKRKACKDCSCGLAEELDAEAALKRGDGPKSSCGSCYLGDAFRCAACPYRGMPAFKPGEKIQLDAVQMSPDL